MPVKMYLHRNLLSLRVRMIFHLEIVEDNAQIVTPNNLNHEIITNVIVTVTIIYSGTTCYVLYTV
jgi:hypothetical protein